MIMTAAGLACAVLAGLAVFQGRLVAGAPLGRSAWGGQHRVLPPGLRIGSAVSIAGYAAMAVVLVAVVLVAVVLVAVVLVAVVLVAAGRQAGGVADIAGWVLTGDVVLGTGLDAVSRSRPERLVMTPVALVLARCSLVVALD